MSEINEMLSSCPIPRVVRARQFFNCDTLPNVPGVLRGGLAAACGTITPGMRVAITCGSRGLDQYVPMLKTMVAFVREAGGVPLLIPSMGSHGGATAQGQAELLRAYGISEETIGAPVLSSMEVVQIGTTPKGLPVYIDKNAYEADGIILFNRVKPHTSFRGKYESGLIKMLAIGLAKQKGAEMTHFLRYENMAENIEAVGAIGLGRLNVLCGVATIENGYNRVAELHVLKKEEILEEEPRLLQAAWRRMPRLALDTLDFLIVNEIGKEISGTGMDTNIIGRFHTRAASGGPNVIKLGVLNITGKSEGNANGMGLADFIPRHMYETIDFQTSYINTLTSTEPSSTRMPMVLENDREVLQACVKLCGQTDPANIRAAFIRSTKYLDEIYLTEAAVSAALLAGIVPVEVTGEYQEVPFDRDGNLLLFCEQALSASRG